jgi:hypothetical protein
MPIRITQLRTETLRQGGNAQQARVTQQAVEVVNQPAFVLQQQMRVTQIAIEFPFTAAAPPGPPPPPPPTQGDTPVPTTCQPPPTAECVTTPALQSTDQTCEALGS